MRGGLMLCVFAVVLVAQGCWGLNAGYYYSSAGGFSNTCAISACNIAQCPVGQYLSGCEGVNAGGCLSCGTPPTNGYWSSYGKTVNTLSCEFTCNVGYTANGAQCIQSQCANGIANSHYTSQVGAPDACPYVCNDGYELIPTANGNLCQACAAGYYSTGGARCTACAAGYYTGDTKATACSQCVAGTYSLTGYSACSVAAKGFYVPTAGASAQIACSGNTYSDQTGSSACSTCLSCPVGQFRYGCTGASAGVCSSCTN